jgi:hypothetical protein
VLIGGPLFCNFSDESTDANHDGFIYDAVFGLPEVFREVNGGVPESWEGVSDAVG